MVSQKDCSGHLSCKNRSVGPPFSRDWCNKRDEYCEYGDNCHFESIPVKMEAFEKWSKTPTGFAERESDYAEGEAAWRASMEKAIDFAEAIPYKTENERLILVALKNRIDKELGMSDV